MQMEFSEGDAKAADLAQAANKFKDFGCTVNNFLSVYPSSPVSLLDSFVLISCMAGNDRFA